MDLIPLSEVAAILRLSLSDTEVITKRADFPSPELRLPQYIYWDKAKVESWLLHLHCDTAELQRIVEVTRTYSEEPKREHFYLTQDELIEDDADILGAGFSIDRPLPLEDDDASEWLDQFGDND